MSSSVVVAIRYDPSSSTLRVTYVSGLVYDYRNVPETVYAEMKLATSKGAFFDDNIKGKYEFERVDDRAEI